MSKSANIRKQEKKTKRLSCGHGKRNFRNGHCKKCGKPVFPYRRP